MLVSNRDGMTYASREDVKRALDIAETARADDQIDRALASATDNVEGLLNRRFYPEVRTQRFNWPDPLGTTSIPHTLYFDRHDVISVTTLTSDEVIAANQYFLYPDDGPPYTRLELDVDGSATFEQEGGGQNSISVAGVFGFSANTEPAGALVAAGITDSATTMDVTLGTDLIGVGDLLVVESERMVVTDKSFIAIPVAQELTAAVPAGSTSSIGVTSGSNFAVGEVILIDAERMLIIDINNNTLAVKRAWDGSTLAAHSLAAPVLGNRRLTVSRAALGTVAAAHGGAVAVAKHRVPPTVRSLAVAEAMSLLLQERTGYARVIGAGEGESEVRGIGLADLRDQALRAYGRKKMRGRAV